MAERVRPLRVLIVEDEPLLAADLRSLIEDAGHAVVGVAADVADALAKAEALDPDTVTLDLRLRGGESGLDVAEGLRGRGAKIVFLTSYNDAETLDRMRRHAPAAVLTKPVAEHELHAALAAAG